MVPDPRTFPQRSDIMVGVHGEVVPMMTGYEIEDALDRGDTVSLRFDGGWTRVVDTAGEACWLRQMLDVGHLGVMLAARVEAD